MPTWLKVVLVIVVLFVAAVGWKKWLSGARAELEARRGPALLAGEAFASTHDANGCVDEAMHRLRQRDGIVDISEHKFFLQGCLEHAERPADFCTGVPAKSELLASSDWLAKKCYRLNYTRTPQKCTGVISAIQAACHPKP